MKRIDTATAVADLFGTGKSGFTDGNPLTATPATQLSAAFFNLVQEEICRVIEAGGGALDGAKYDQLLTALRSSKFMSATAAGTANALTADFSPDYTAWTDGMPLYVRAAAANTSTTPTIAIDSLVAKTIVKGNGLALAAGDIAGGGHWLELQYDATLDKVVLQNPATGINVASGYKGLSQEFTSSGSFTVPAGVTQIFASGCAAGGGGAGSSGSGSSYTGGGGGSGQSITRKPIAVTPGQVITITIGAAGTGGAAGANNGVDGGNTVIGAITLLGGGGGKTLASGPGLGGKGGGCHGAWLSATACAGGNGASGPFGQGGVVGGWATGATAYAGGAAVGYGSGGAGAASCYNGSGASAAGGSGTQGYVNIEW